jgi:serine/threonine protein kinase/tetratricopeptide (TPR) repeat protein
MSDSERLQNVLWGALELAPHQRASYLDAACRGDAAMRAEIESLLKSHADAGRFLAEPSAIFHTGLDAAPGATDGDPASTSLREGPGSRVGPYKLLQLIGEGGFGSVFMAEQEHPVRRKVALKVIKLGMDTRQVVARFEQERQALAMMDHPNIARVLDAGATDTGRPYFVMELVRGEPITHYCDKHQLSVEERLRLFQQTCNAVQHAHQKGIIHRDIKPGNVLVTLHDGKPVPKVIDFGIAKATGQRLTEMTVFTEYRQFIGTPEYMSPEQAEMSGIDIDTRSDVYSLGVLLYELLTSTTPFDSKHLRSAGYSEIHRIIREETPHKPSTRLSTLETLSSVAAHRHTEPKKLGLIVRGDLDWIVMKALEKDRTRRYETASGFSADIERYLEHEPVVASPPSTGYKLRKFVRRNRAAVWAGALVAAVLVLGVIGTTWGMLRALRERERADAAATAVRSAEARAHERADALEKVARFQAEQLSGIDVARMGFRLRDGLLRKVRVAAERSRLTPDEINARMEELEKITAGADFTGLATETLDADVFQRALAAIEDRFADQPMVKASLLQTVADSLVHAGLLEEANAPQDEALRIRRSELGADHPDTLASVNAAAILRGEQGKYDEARPLLQEAIEKRRRVLGADHPDTLASIFAMGTLLYFQGRYADAEPCFREALEGRRRVLPEGHPDTLQSLRAEGSLRLAQGKLGEAEALHREAVEMCRRTLGADHPDTLTAMSGLSGALKWQGKYAEAEGLDRSILEGHRRLHGDDHPDTLSAMSNLAETLRNLKKYSEAEVLLREATSRQRRLLGGDHPDTLVSISRLGMLLCDMGKYEAAEPCYREALEGRRRRLGNDHPNTLTSLSNMGFLLQKMGRLAEAEASYREALEVRRRTSGEDHPATLTTLFELGRLQVAQDKLADSARTFRDVLERRRRVLGNDHPDTQETLQALGVVVGKTGQYDEAERLLSECYRLRLGALPEGDPRIYEALSLLGAAVAKQGRRGEAETMLLDAHAKLEVAGSDSQKLDATRRIVELYDAWNGVDPKRGYDARGDDWRAKLNAMKTSASTPSLDKKD